MGNEAITEIMIEKSIMSISVLQGIRDKDDIAGLTLHHLAILDISSSLSSNDTTTINSISMSHSTRETLYFSCTDTSILRKVMLPKGSCNVRELECTTEKSILN